MTTIKTVSGKVYSQFTDYINLKGFSRQELGFIETCMSYIISADILKVNKKNTGFSVVEIGCEVGHEIIQRGYVDTGNIKKENISKRYIEALADILDYIRVGDKEKVSCHDTVNEAYKIHLSHIKNGEDKDTNGYYENIIVLASIDEAFHKKKKEFRFIEPDRFTKVLNDLHKCFYMLFIHSKVINSESDIEIQPLSLVDMTEMKCCDFSIVINGALIVLLIDSEKKYNEQKWKEVEYRYQSLIIDSVLNEDKQYFDAREIRKLQVYRVQNAEIEMRKDLDTFIIGAYTMYCRSEIRQLLDGIEETTLGLDEFYSKVGQQND